MEVYRDCPLSRSPVGEFMGVPAELHFGVRKWKWGYESMPFDHLYPINEILDLKKFNDWFKLNLHQHNFL